MFRQLNRLLIIVAALFSWASLAANELILEEVIVTAQKREGIAQDIPLALTVLEESMLQANVVKNVEDLSALVPGLDIVSTAPSSYTIAMRGIVALGGPIAPVGYYLDEIPVASFGGSAPEIALWDLQRVEVLRGPQGTLFGDGSMAGTIRAITNKPQTESFEGNVYLSGWDYSGGKGGYEARGLVNVPVSDTFAIRASAGYEDDKGYILQTDLDEKGANGFEQGNARLAGRWTPTEKTDIDLSFTYYKLEQGRNAEQTAPGLYDPVGYFPPGWTIPATRPNTRDVKYGLYNLTVEHDFGAASLISATSYFDKSGSSFDDLNVFVPGFFFGAPVADFLPDSSAADIALANDEQAFTQELRLVSNGDNRLDWTVGAFYKSVERTIDQGFDLRVNLDLGLVDPDLAGVVVPIADEFGHSKRVSDLDSWAIFAEIDYELTDSLSLIAGLRYYSDDRKYFHTTVAGSDVFGNPEGEIIRLSGDDSATSPKLALSWKTSDAVTLFASASKGFRSGGFNANANISPDIPESYNSETLWTYEVGVKSNPTDRLLANFYLYYNDWTDVQLGIVTDDGLFAYTENAGKADATGAELEMVYLMTANLASSLSVSYIDSQISESILAPDGVVEIVTKGNELPFVAPWSFNVGLDYNKLLANGKTFQATGNWYYKDRTFSNPSNSEIQKNDSYNMLNARAGISWGNWGLYVFGRNLTNTDATTLKTRPVEVLTDITFSVYVPPRTLGLELQANF